MKDHSESRTSVTLLGRVQSDQDDVEAWETFCARYAPHILLWCKRWGLQDADAQDVCQDVLLRLTRVLRTFRYDPSRSFRAWLKTLSHHAWRDFLEGRRRSGASSGDPEAWSCLQDIEARDDLARNLEDEFDRELLEVAMRRVRPRVADHTWEAFRLLAFEGHTGAEVASALEMSISMTFVARSRVQRLIQQELRRLEESEEV